MIDMPAFVAACARPFDDVTSNCLIAACEAFPDSERMRAVAAWWCAMPSAEREGILASHTLCERFAVLERTLDFHRTPTIASGREIGLCDLGVVWPNAVAVGAPGAWFVRGHRGAVKLPRRCIVRAWSV